ncbi:MAG: ATP-binding protein, partial [Pseudomonadota bacterium]
TIEIDPTLPQAVRGHHASIYRILLNLTGNALKFTKTGSVQLRAFLSETIAANQVRVGLEVKDTGIGIPEDQHEIIFEKLKRLTPSYEGKIEGSGIGLYIVDQYVKRMNGIVEVESALGKGSTFTVLLPLSIAPDISTASVNETQSQPITSSSITFKPTASEHKKTLPANAPRIFLVEDNPLIQHVTEALLNGAGFSVDIAGTGAEALEKFSPGKYGLVYMDIGLPDQDGYSVAHAIREKEKSLATPIIALTAHGALDVERFCSRAGMQGVLSKPLTREQATSVWERYGLGKSEKVDGLTMIENTDKTPVASQIIDIKGTASLLGSKDRAKELLTLWFEMLTKRFLPALHDLISKHDIEGLRHELHAMLGSLCYVKTPLLNQALLELQTATRNHPQEIENAYQRVLQESQRFIDQYQKQLISKSH